VSLQAKGNPKSPCGAGLLANVATWAYRALLWCPRGSLMRFSYLNIRGWRQFSGVGIGFHPRLTIIAGANGAGKSTLLRLLSQHFGLSYQLVATPTFSEKGVLRYLSGLFGLGRADQPDRRVFGEITYDNGVVAPLSIPNEGGALYQIQIGNGQPIEGLFISSHRPTSVYQSVTNIPTNALSAEQAYQLYNQEVQNKYNNSFTQYSPTYRIKEAIISMATFGPGNRNVQRNVELEQTFDDFKSMLSRVLPDTIGFRDINIRIPDVVIVTRTGEFVLDSASGGLMAIIDLAWQVFLFSRGRKEFVVIIDEPENHLHPSMQRSLIGNLLQAFPVAQFIIATHSPFVVSSVRDSSVYVLRYEDGEMDGSPSRTVYSEQLDNVNKAGTASEILRNVLGVPVTLPLWAESEIEEIASNFRMETIDRATIAELRARLDQAGLGEFYADALARVAARQ
jgi:AAA15 family ATPase/GTPase